MIFLTSTARLAPSFLATARHAGKWEKKKKEIYVRTTRVDSHHDVRLFSQGLGLNENHNVQVGVIRRIGIDPLGMGRENLGWRWSLYSLKCRATRVPLPDSLTEPRVNIDYRTAAIERPGKCIGPAAAAEPRVNWFSRNNGIPSEGVLIHLFSGNTRTIASPVLSLDIIMIAFCVLHSVYTFNGEQLISIPWEFKRFWE